MKILKIISLFIILNYTQSYCQKKGGEAIYGIYFAEDSLLSKSSPKLYESYKMARLSSEKLDLVLSFTKNNSSFYLKDIIEDSDTKLAIAWGNCKKNIFVDLSKKVKLFNTMSDNKGIFKDKEFLITESLDTLWQITSETKMIQNFKCYKATQNIKYTTTRGFFSKTIIAWYCPEIPFNFGPKGYSGLPGLILELQDKNLLYGIKSIRFRDDLFDITMPSEGKVISFKEYEDINKDRTTKYMKMME